MSRVQYVQYSDSNGDLLNTKIILKQYNDKFGGFNIVIQNCLIDEGSTLSYIKLDTVKNTKEIKSVPTDKFYVSNTANQNIGSVMNMVTGNIFIPIYDCEVISAKLYILENINYAVILGLDILGPIRKKMHLDPAYINNMLRNPKISYNDILINIDADDKLMLEPHQTYIVNKKNIYLKPFERKMISITCEPINDKNFNISLLSHMTKYIKIDRFKFEKDQNCLSLQNLHDKVLCIKSGIPIAEKTDIINANELFELAIKQKSECNNLLKVSELPLEEQKIY